MSLSTNTNQAKALTIAITPLAMLLYLGLGCCSAAHSQTKAPMTTNTAIETQNKKQAKILTENAKKYNKILEGEEALKLANQAISLNPKCYGAYIERALAYICLGKTEQALADFTTAAGGNERKSEKEARREKADLLFRLNRYSESVKELTTLETKYGSLSDGMLYRRSHAYLAMGKPNLAAQDLTTAIKGEPNSERLFEARIKAYMALKDWDKALADCNKCISLCNKEDQSFGNRGDLLALRATIYDKMGKKDLANKDREVAKKTDSANYQNAPFRTEKTRR